MKWCPILILLAPCLLQSGRSPEPTVFVASTPCDLPVRTMLSIPEQIDCEFITWTLTLHRDPRKLSPAAYSLHYTYGMAKAGTRGFLNGGMTGAKDGSWRIVTADRNQAIYQLNADTPETTLSFRQLDDHLLHLLDPQGKLMIGHGGWSYTLNKRQ